MAATYLKSPLHRCWHEQNVVGRGLGESIVGVNKCEGIECQGFGVGDGTMPRMPAVW